MIINVELVRKLLANQFPQWAGLPIVQVIPGGWDNRTFRLGEHMLVRLPSAPEYNASVKIEQTWLPKLAFQLPLKIPKPLAIGVPSQDYSFHWSIYNWIDGIVGTDQLIEDTDDFAKDLARFLNALGKIDSSGGPNPGPANFYRGGHISVYDDQTRCALEILKNKIDHKKAYQIWQEAIETKWENPPVWVHGDLAISNLLFKDKKLHAVIDWGCMAIGDPACDLSIAWTFFKGPSRKNFRDFVDFDSETWLRGKAWALWKALLICAEFAGTDKTKIGKSWECLNQILNSKDL